MSVNGRPFRPDPTSYQMTGIPCGNPKRYKSRAVIRMTRDDKVPYEDQQIGIPGQGTETEAEKEFKKLLDQQMNISASAAEKKVNFINSTREIMGTAAGFMTLKQFQQVSETDKKTNEFRSLGFTDLQIGVMLHQEGGEMPSRKRKVADCFVPHPDYVAQSLTELRELQDKRDAELFAAANSGPQMSRHRLQLEAALLQGKTHLPLAHIYVNGAKKFSQQLMEINAAGASVNDVLLPTLAATPSRSPSPPNGTTNGKENGKGNNKENGSTSGKKKGDEKVVITGKVEWIKEEEFEKGKLSKEEVLKQFPNYSAGSPFKTLCVKNLDKDVSAPDLVSIFARFQEEGKDKIGFKLMDGRMKGQAFITFHDEATATKALELVHGFVFKGKSMIVQYGRPQKKE